MTLKYAILSPTAAVMLIPSKICLADILSNSHGENPLAGFTMSNGMPHWVN